MVKKLCKFSIIKFLKIILIELGCLLVVIFSLFERNKNMLIQSPRCLLSVFVYRSLTLGKCEDNSFCGSCYCAHSIAGNRTLRGTMTIGELTGARFGMQCRGQIRFIFRHLRVFGWNNESQQANLKNGVFWDVTPCGSCKNRRFVCLLITVFCHPNAGGAKFLRNVGSFKIHTA
jgi:hypothetical protein